MEMLDNYQVRWHLTSVVFASPVYSKASLVLGSFRKRRSQQIMASGVVNSHGAANAPFVTGRCHFSGSKLN